MSRKKLIFFGKEFFGKKSIVSSLFHRFDAVSDLFHGGAVQFGPVAAGGAVAEFFPLFFDGFQGVKAVFQSHIAFGEGVGGQIFRRGFAA